MGFSLRQAFSAVAAAAAGGAAVFEMSAHNTPVAIGFGILAGMNIITAGLTYDQPG